MESSPQLSAHDLVTLCKLEGVAIHYSPPTRGATPPLTGENPNEPLLWRQLDSYQSTSNVMVIDIRSKEEYPLYYRCTCTYHITLTIARGEIY